MTTVNISNPLSEPYRTGSYLVYDMPPGAPDHVRSAWSLKTHRYPASGSRQLDADQLKKTLAEVIAQYSTGDLFLVDLRQETHGFLDTRAASWYADNDFANVGQSKEWIEADEAARLRVLTGQPTQVFTIKDDPADNRDQQRVMPVSYEQITVAAASTEQMVFDKRKLGACTIHYVRIPVTDHCAAAGAALEALRTVPVSLDPKVWVHFHCHGGDGRTTTFLALYDMLCWKKSNDPAFPPLTEFACRQYGLAPNYCLNPDGCDCGTSPSPPIAGWKRSLAIKRWQVLEAFHQSL
jgi:hypothetical protein